MEQRILDYATLDNGVRFPVVGVPRTSSVFPKGGFGAFANFNNFIPQIIVDTLAYDLMPDFVREYLIAHEKAHLDLGHAFIPRMYSEMISTMRPTMEIHADTKAAFEIGLDKFIEAQTWMADNAEIFTEQSFHWALIREQVEARVEQVTGLFTDPNVDVQEWIEKGREYMFDYARPDLVETMNYLAERQNVEATV